MSDRMDRRAYAEMFGPTVGDRRGVALLGVPKAGCLIKGFFTGGRKFSMFFGASEKPTHS
jgi:hypothetical protein